MINAERIQNKRLEVTAATRRRVVKRKRREETSFEKRLMRGLRLKNVRQLDKLWEAPISRWAADHSEPPDEDYDRADRMYEEADRQREARRRFNELTETKYLN
jgi:hypothetical protein